MTQSLWLTCMSKLAMSHQQNSIQLSSIPDSSICDNCTCHLYLQTSADFKAVVGERAIGGHNIPPCETGKSRRRKGLYGWQKTNPLSFTSYIGRSVRMHSHGYGRLSDERTPGRTDLGDLDFDGFELLEVWLDPTDGMLINMPK